MARKSDTVQEIFLKACNENNLVKVNACIQLEVDINCEVVNREFVTLDDNEEEVFKDFDQDMNGFHGSTGLHIAAKKGFSELVDILLDHPNIECNILDNYGRTPLLCASTVEILQKLLDDDRVDVNVANSNSESVLFTHKDLTSKAVHPLESQKRQKWRNCFGRVLQTREVQTFGCNSFSLQR